MKKYLLSILLSATCLNTFPQPEPLKNYPTPSAANLGIYGEIPVSLYTGTPNINIPVYELKEGSLTVPIHLSYHLSSIKPNSHPGWVGLGWNLLVGGCITRNVKGYYDEQQYTDGHCPGFYANYSKLDKNDWSNSTFLSDNTEKLQELTKKNGKWTHYELMADEFNFNFGNYSGSFYLDEKGQWVVNSESDIKVDFNSSNGFISLNDLRPEINTHLYGAKEFNNRFFNYFTLITPDGVKYSFGGKYATEFSISYYNRKNAHLIPTSWFLSKITSPEGQEITFSYMAGDPICEVKPSYYQTTVDKGVDNVCTKGYIIDGTRRLRAMNGFLLFPVYLKEIKGAMSEIKFSSSIAYDKRPEDYYLNWNSEFAAEIWNPYTGQTPENFEKIFIDKDTVRAGKTYYVMKWRKLDNIEVLSKNGTSKKFNFFYDSPLDGRLKLKYFAELCHRTLFSTKSVAPPIIPPLTISDCEKVYHFNYYSEKKLPDYCTTQEDHWGFYNGYGNEIWQTSFSEDSYFNTRQPDYSEAFIKAEVLKEIIYPTGGKTSFEYNLHDYSKALSEELTLTNIAGSAGGLRVKSISSYSADDKLLRKKNYYYTNNEYPSTSNSSGIIRHHYTSDSYKTSYNISKIGLNYVQYSAGGIRPFGTNIDANYIGYSSVIEESIGEDNKNNGFIRYTFSSYDKDIWGEMHLDEGYLSSTLSNNNYFNIYSSKSVERGKLLSEEYYEVGNKLIKKITYKYSKNIVEGRSEYLRTVNQEQLMLCPYTMTSVPIAYAYKTYLYNYLLSSKEETNFINTDPVIRTTSYEYNKHNMQTRITENSNTSDKVRFNQYIYISNSEVNTEPINKMKRLNILTPILKEYSGIVKNGTDYYTSGTEYSFKEFYDGIIKPENAYELATPTSVTASNISQNLFHKYSFSYDKNGNILQVNRLPNQITSYIWGYKGIYPIAKIDNVKYQEIKDKLGDNFINNVYNMTSLSETETNKINSLRTIFPHSLIKSFTFEPLFGITSITDERGITTYYKHDSDFRLKYITDDKENVIEKYEYYYPENNY